MALYEETRQLQEELNKKFEVDDPIKYLVQQVNSYSPVPTGTLDKSVIYGKPDRRNYERFFGNVYDPTYNIENAAGLRQSGAEKLAYMIPRIGVKVASEVAQMPGYLGGLITWGTTGLDPEQLGLMVDNIWIKAVQSVEEAAKDKMPVYVRDEVKEGGLMRNILSPEFWATEGADGIGFLLSFLVPGQVLKAGKIGAKAARLMKPGAKTSKLFLEGAVPTKATAALGTAKLAENIDLVSAAFINTLFESAAEAGESYRNILDKTGDASVAGENAVDVLKKNFGLLLLSNAVDQYWLFKDINLFKAGAVNGAEKAAKKSVMDRLIDPRTNKRLSEISKPTKWSKFGTFTKDVLAGTGKEGFFEEGSQFAISKRAEYLAEHPEEDDASFAEELRATVDTYLDSITDTDMQKSIFLGSILGGGMASIGSIRERKVEQRLLEGTPGKTPSPFAKFFGAKERAASPGLKQLLDRSFASFHDTYMDLVVKEIDPETNELVPVTETDEYGNVRYKLDKDKVNALGLEQAERLAEKEILMNYALEKNNEGFWFVKNQMDFKRMSIYLSQPGGINALMRNIDEWAELEAENFAKEGLGGESLSIEAIKKDLKEKALRFQEIYDRIDTTHGLAILDVKVDKESKNLFPDFSERVKANKISEEVRLDHAERRINQLRKDLANLKTPITSSENTTSENLTTELKEQVIEKDSEISKLTKDYIDQTIKNIERHQETIKSARKASANLYDSKWLNKTFKDYVADKKAKENSIDKGSKAEEAIGLLPKVKALYDKSTLIEDITDERNNRARIVHSAELEITYTDEEGKAHKAIGRIPRNHKTDTGNLNFIIEKAEETTKSGKVRMVDSDEDAFINEDDTFVWKNNRNIRNKIVQIEVIKSAEEVRNERANRALLEGFKNQLEIQKKNIILLKGGSVTEIIEGKEKTKVIKGSIKLQREYITELKEKIKKLQQKELESLEKYGRKETTEGTARKEQVGIFPLPDYLSYTASQAKDKGEGRRQMFLASKELSEQLKIAENELVRLKNNLALFEENRIKIQEYISKAKQDGSYLTEFESLRRMFTDVVQTTNRIIADNEDELQESQLYLNRVRSTLRGYYTTFAKVLGVADILTAIRTDNSLTPDQKDQTIVDLFADLLSNSTLTDEQLVELGTLPQNIERLKEIISSTQEHINELEVMISGSKASLEQDFKNDLYLLDLLYKKYRDRYRAIAESLQILESVADKDTQELITPEDTFDDIRTREKNLLDKYEENFLHPLKDEYSWLVSTGNQESLRNDPDNDDLARWYIFVNKLARRGMQKDYILRSFSYSMMKDLKNDDPIRKRLKFYTGDNKRLTYDEIQALSANKKERAEREASEDIKMVVYRKDGSLLYTTNQVIGKEGGKNFIIYNSFPKEEFTALKYKRFSLKKLEKKLLKSEYGIDNPKDATKDQLKSVQELARKHYEDTFTAYTKFREETLKKKSQYFGISMINPGVINESELGEWDVLEGLGATNIEDLGKENFIIHKLSENSKKYGETVTHNISGAPHGLMSGYLYVYHDNVPFLVKPKTLEETGSVEDVLNIIRYLATNPHDYIDVEQFLHKILFINASSPKYNIFFTKYRGEEGERIGFRSLLFGDTELTSKEIVEGKRLDELRSFLADKYWNFDSASMGSTTFTEFKIKEFNGKLVPTSRRWDVEDGGYMGFLFNTKYKGTSNVPKGTVKSNKPKSTPLDTVKAGGQRLNQSISLTKEYDDFKQIKNKKGSPSEAESPKKSKVRDKLKKLKEEVEDTETDTKTTKSVSGVRSKLADLKAKKVTEEKLKTEEDSAFNSETPTIHHQFTTPEELWNNKEATPKEVKEYYTSQFGDNAMQERFNAYQTKTGINRRIEEIDNYTRENFSVRAEWYRKKFPQIPINEINAILMGDSWGKLTAAGRTLISDIAAEGTIYHEAYHTYSLIFLDPEIRQKLYDEVKRRTGKKMSDKEIEEFLAEEFREFMTSPENYKFNKDEEIKKSWFQKILDRILSFLGYGKSNLIEQNFNNIRDTKEFVLESDVLQERIKNIVFDRNWERPDIVKGLTEKEIMHYTQDFNYQFFQTLFNPNININPDTIFDLDVRIEDLYSRIKGFYLGESMTNLHARNILDHFNDIKKHHQRLLKKYGIELADAERLAKRQEEFIREQTEKGVITDEQEEIIGDNQGKNSLELVDSNLVDMSKLIDRPIRMLIAGLPSVTMVNTMERGNSVEIGMRSTIEYTKIIRVLQDNLSTLTSVEAMLEKIDELSASYPSLKILLKRLGVTDDGAYNPDVKQTILMNQFYRLFSLNKNNPLILNYSNDGNMYFMDAASDNVKSLIRKEWIENARDIADLKGSFITKDKKGTYRIKIANLKKKLKEYAEADSADKIILGESILDGLGIELSKAGQLIYEKEIVKKYLFWLNEEFKDTKDNPLARDLFNNDVIRNQREVAALVEYVAKSYLNEKDLSYFNQEGNREFVTTLNSHISNITNLLDQINNNSDTETLNIPEEIEHLLEWNSDLNRGNLFNRNSYYLKLLKNNYKIEMVLLKGNKSTRAGKEISRAVLGDYKAITFNALLNGIVPLIRSAERKLEYGFRIKNIEGKTVVDYNISDDIFINTMENYLKDELSTTFALILDPQNWGGNLVNYSKNGKNLRVFKFLQDHLGIENFEEFVNSNVDFEYEDLKSRNAQTRKQTVEQVDKLVKIFTTSHKAAIKTAFKNYIKDMEEMTIKSLQEDNVVNIKGNVIYAKGLDPEVLSKMGIKNKKTLNFAELQKIVKVATYNSFVGNNEQLKLYLGDLAYYTNPKEFHKRVMGSNSTKYNQRDDVTIREHLDNNYTRLDGKKRGDSLSMLVVNDQYTNNNSLAELKKEFAGYAKAKGTDGQSWVMLDEYRDIMLRHGMWYPRHEKTYQYDQQKLVIRLIKLAEDGRDIPFSIEELRGMFESPSGVFNKHTRGIVPAVPMYNGNEVKESECTPLTILKPQGFGTIPNVIGLNPTQFLKTSTASIFMSAIDENSPMFDFLLNMIKNKQDMLTFESALKTEILGDENGKIQDIYSRENYITQEFRYRDFGIQLDIHEETEGEVTVSTQRTRLEFLDVFNLGNPIDEKSHLAEARHEYTELTGEIEQTLRKQFIGELGLKEKEVLINGVPKSTYFLPEENRNKFENRLIRAFENRAMPINVIDGLMLSLSEKKQLNNNHTKVFDATITKFKIEEILTSMVRNTLIKRRVFGEMLIQESAFLYENPNKKRLLNFYEKTKEGITPMEVMIAVPKSLVKWVDSIGGVDVLNNAIEQHDTKLLGEDFFKLLTIPANRIPGQSLSSLDVLKIKKFLPHYHGNKVVIPAEAVVKTGSDFDVDKLTTYFNDFKIVDGKIVYKESKDSLGAMQNRLNSLAVKSLLDPTRFDELMTPLDPGYLRAQAEKIKETRTFSDIERRSIEGNISDVTQWWYNMQKGYEFWTSKHGTSASAVHNAAHAIEQNNPLELGNIYTDDEGKVVKASIIPLMFEGQELGENEIYRSGFIKDSSGRNISNNLAEFISAFIDIKDLFAFLITDDKTFNAIAALNRFGKNSGVGMDLIIGLYSQDVIKNYLKANRANSAQYMYTNQYAKRQSRKDRLDSKQQYINTLSKIRNILQPTDKDLPPYNYNHSVASAVEDYINVRTSIYKASEELYPKDMDQRQDRINYTENHPSVKAARDKINSRITAYKYTYLTKADLDVVKAFNVEHFNMMKKADNITKKEQRGEYISEQMDRLREKYDFNRLYRLQVQMLDNYKMYDQLGWNLVTVNSFLRPDASSNFLRHLASIETSLIATHDTIRRRGIFNEESVINALSGTEENPSLLTEFYNTKFKTPEIFSWTSVIHSLKEDGSNSVIKNFFEKEIYSKIGEPGKWLSAKEREAVLEEIESDFITFLIVRSFGTGLSIKDMQHNYRYLMQGKESVAKQLYNLKRDRKLSKNMAIQELETLIDQTISQSQSVSEVDNISLFSKGFDVAEWDAMEADLYNLHYSNEDNGLFVKSLILASLFQSGLRKSPISFQEIIPNRILYPIAIKAIDSFTAQEEDTQLDQLRSFKEQLMRNSVDNTDIVPRSGFVFKGLRDKSNSNILFPPPEYVDDTNYWANTEYFSALYYLGERPKEGKSPLGIALYRRKGGSKFELVAKMGDGFRFKEYYPMATLDDLDGRVTIIDSNVYDYKVTGPKLDLSIADETEPTSENTESSEDGFFPKISILQPTKKGTPKRKAKLHGLEATDLIEDDKINQKNDYAKSSQPITKIHPILRQIENNSEVPAHRMMAKILREEIKTPVNLTIYDDEWRDNNPEETTNRSFNAYHMSDPHNLRTIGIGVYENLSNISFERGLLHECIHELTLRKYNFVPKFKVKIDNLLEHSRHLVLEEISKRDSFQDLDLQMIMTALSNGEEFIAYGMTSPMFQELLNTIPAKDENNIIDNNKSVFREFLETIYDLLSEFFSRHPKSESELSYTAFKELVSITSDMITISEDELIIEADENLDSEQLESLIYGVVSPSERQAEGKETNERELSKDNVKLNEEVPSDFDSIYPEYSYLTPNEKTAFQEAVNKGEIQIACKI